MKRIPEEIASVSFYKDTSFVNYIIEDISEDMVVSEPESVRVMKKMSVNIWLRVFRHLNNAWEH